MSPATATTTTRWCPTPEQLMILEELYRRGLKTPNSSQIQKITSHLSLYGKIQGKNVFYWFQNHKARDRQKLRKKLHQQQQIMMQQQHMCYQLHLHQTQFHDTCNNSLPTHYYYPGQNLQPLQCITTSAFDEAQAAAGVLMRPTWCSDLKKDYIFNNNNNNNNINSNNVITTANGSDDSVMINYMEVGPTFARIGDNNNDDDNNNRPLETLELFPLTSSFTDTKDQESQH